jgi:hypothetical protein
LKAREPDEIATVNMPKAATIPEGLKMSDWPGYSDDCAIGELWLKKAI